MRATDQHVEISRGKALFGFASDVELLNPEVTWVFADSDSIRRSVPAVGHQGPVGDVMSVETSQRGLRVLFGPLLAADLTLVPVALEHTVAERFTDCLLLARHHSPREISLVPLCVRGSELYRGLGSRLEGLDDGEAAPTTPRMEVDVLGVTVPVPLDLRVADVGVTADHPHVCLAKSLAHHCLNQFV